LNGRERLIAAAGGMAVDRKPIIAWPMPNSDSDAYVTCSHEPGACPDGALKLAAVANPFGQALKAGVDIRSAFEEDPVEGATILDGLVALTEAEVQFALKHGFDGVFYLVYGARAGHTTPMEYGGHYLERDREILSGIAGAQFNLVFVLGGEDAYLDFVSDLPAHAFGWDSVASGVSVAQIRAMRPGLLATNSPDADIELRFGLADVAEHLESEIQNPKSQIPVAHAL